MPFSTSSAVRMPGSERPSSTSVIATAGCMPTTTVSASQHARHGGNIPQHAPDEGIYHIQRRDVDQDAVGLHTHNHLGQIIL